VRTTVAAALAALLAACKPAPPEPGPRDLSAVADGSFVVDLAGIDLAGQTLTVVPTWYSLAQKTQTAIADGDAVDLTLAPQGGFYLFIGFLARNVLDPAHLKLSVAVLDGATALSTVTLFPKVSQTPSDPTVWTPDGTNYFNVANLGFCPSSATSDVFGRPFTLTLTITDGMSASAPTATASRSIVPSCTQAATADRLYCQCTCAAGWTPGKCAVDM